MSFLHVLNSKHIVSCIVKLIFHTRGLSVFDSNQLKVLHELPEARMKVCALAAQLARLSLQGPTKPNMVWSVSEEVLHWP